MKLGKFNDPPLRSRENVEDKTLIEDVRYRVHGWLMKDNTIQITRIEFNLYPALPPKPEGEIKRQIKHVLGGIDKQLRIRKNKKQPIPPNRSQNRPVSEIMGNPITLFGYKKPHEHKNQESSTNL